MAKPVDVFITEAELAEGRKAKRTTCLKVDQEVLRPVHCVSRPGISSGTLFTRAEPLRMGRYLTDREMASMYDKFVGTSSLNNAAVRLEQEERDAAVQPSASSSTAASSRAARAPYHDSGDRAPPPPSAAIAVAMAAAGCHLPSQVHSPEVDEQARERAAAAATMKYVAPRIARKYGITQSITPAGSRAAAAAAAASRATAGGRSVGASAAKNRLQAVDSSSSLAASGGDGRPPRPRSAAFNTTSRDQAQRTGSHFIFRGSESPAPGKYNPKYGATDKAQHAPVWSKLGQVGSGGEDGADSRPGSAPAAGGGRGGGGSSRPASAPSHRTPDDGTDPSAPHDAPQAAQHAQQAGTAAAAAAARHGFSRSLSSRPAAAGGGGGGGAARISSEARAQLQQRHEELFGAAHKVHHRRRPEGPPGSQPFKAVERKTLYDTQPGGQLFAEYYKEGYDSLTRKASRPSSAFHTQSQRPYPAEQAGETGPTVGPGTYGKQPPGTNTGRHVPAGHPGLTRTPDWSRTTPRPVSAPAVRPPPASAVHHGYWGPDGPATSLFPDDPEYNEINAVRMLQERTSQRTPGLPTRRPSQQQQQQQQQQQWQQQQWQQAGSAAQGLTAAAKDAAASGGRGGGGGVRRPLVYVGPERYGELTSAGLAKRVPGGVFDVATRESMCHAMRAIANPHITPPAAVLVKATKDLSYDYDYAVEGHRGRPPAWHLPPNRNAMSQQWMEAAATAYLA